MTLSNKFHFMRFGILEPNLPKKGIFGRKWKSEHHYWILYIRISLGTNFHFKQTTFNFGIKFAQKRYFWSKREKVIIAIEFWIFELV